MHKSGYTGPVIRCSTNHCTGHFERDTFDKVPTNTDMFNWSPCISLLLYFLRDDPKVYSKNRPCLRKIPVLGGARSRRETRRSVITCRKFSNFYSKFCSVK